MLSDFSPMFAGLYEFTFSPEYCNFIEKLFQQFTQSFQDFSWWLEFSVNPWQAG